MSNTPNIRFKGFTDSWEQRKLSDIASKAVDNRGKTPPISDDGTHPLIEVACLGNGAPDYSKIEKYLDDDTFNTALRGYIKEGDILFSTVGSIGLVSIMDKAENAAIAQNIVAFRAKENYNSKFLYAMFSTEENQDKAKRIVMGAVQPSIKVSQLVNVKYSVAQNITEQRKLGEYFLNLDHIIALHQRKCDELSELKKFMLQKMFPKNSEQFPEIRFSGFTAPWERRRFGDIFEEYSEKNHGELPALMIIQGGGTIRRDASDRSLSYDKENLSNYKMVNKGDFIVHLRSFEGGLEMATDTGIISPAYHTFHGENTDSRFYYSYFRSKKFIDTDLKPHVYGIRDGRSIDINGMKTIKIPYTSSDEQRAIGEYIERLDNFITIHQRKCDELRNFKRFMLQNMFPKKG